MAGTYDNEQQRIADRIKCVAFREARDAGATFITRQWIADKIHRSIRFVTDWWEKAYDECFSDYSECGRKLELSQDSQNIILNASGKQKKAHPLWQGKLQRDKMSMLREAQSITTDIGWD